MQVIGDFARRENSDSTVDLICTRCFQTIAHGSNEKAFEDARKNHKCDPLSEQHRRFAQAKGE